MAREKATVSEIGPLARRITVSVGPDHSLAEAARKMNAAKVGSAIVFKQDGQPGIITERDLLRAIADGTDLENTAVADYMTQDAISASGKWDVEQAARRMLDGGFRHLVVLDEKGEPVGMLSIRDLVVSLLDQR
ncbi:MAG: CBS domain-containing protein [Actinomycetota bacterium]